MTRRRFRPLLALCAIASLLFMQLAVVAFACPGAQQMQAAVESSAPAAHQPGCDGMDAAPPALCRAHCQPGAQSLDKPASLAVVAASCFVLPFVPGSVAAAAPAPAESLASLFARATAPPLAIRHCCLRI